MKNINPQRPVDAHAKSGTSEQVQSVLRSLANPEQARNLQRFFKTGPGEYGAGDTFLGIKVPVQRTVARKFESLPPAEAIKLLRSTIHEYRLTGLIILGNLYAKAQKSHDDIQQDAIARALMANRQWINNWDLVDTIAPRVLGSYLLPTRRDQHRQLAHSNNLWDRRIAIVGTLGSILRGEFSDTLDTARLLLHDNHDLIQKAVGWMLREVGKRDVQTLKKFLDDHAGQMPRTMLRYAIERLPEAQRQSYLHVRQPSPMFP